MYLSGCIPENGNDNAASCPSPASMSDGEIVTYKFTYENGETLNHTFTKLQDGNESGEVIYSISDGRTFNYELNKLCPNKPATLTSEAFFLLLDGSLKEVALPSSDGNEKPPIEFVKTSCNHVTLTVVAGIFSAQTCTFDAKDSSESFTNYVHNNQGADTPLSGLLKYKWNNASQKVTVELTEWNRL